MLIQQRMTMATIKSLSFSVACVCMARSTNLQRIGLDLPIYSLSSKFIVHKPSIFFSSFVRFFLLMPWTLIVWSCPSFCAIFLCLYLYIVCISYIFSFSSRNSVGLSFFWFGPWISVKKKTNVNWNESIFCVSGCMHQKNIQFLKGSPSLSVASQYFWVLLLLRVISYCFLLFFSFSLSISILLYEFG